MNKKRRKTCFDFTEEAEKMLNTLSKENNLSKTKLMESLLCEKYSMQMVDENIILGRLSEMERKMMLTDHAVEAIGHLFIDYLQMFFLQMPDLRRGEEGQGDLQKAALRTAQFLKAHKTRMEGVNIRFCQKIFADSVEVPAKKKNKDADEEED